MTDPFGLMKFAECEHQQLKCEKCGARSDIRGWQTFTGQDKDMLELRDEIDRLTARLAAAEDRVEKLREAIKPFAEFSRLLGDFRDVDSVIRRKSWLVSDFRKASEAYGDD